MIDTMSTNKQTNVTYRTIYIDLNGVLDMYDGWKGHYEKFPMRVGARDFLAQLKVEGWQIKIFTATDPALAREFLEENGLMPFVDEVTNIKGPAVIYLDDRGLKFDGVFSQTWEQIRNFRTHWEKE